MKLNLTKKIALLSLAFLSFQLLKAQSPQEFKSPIEYLNFIGKQHENVNKRYVKLQSTQAHSNKEKRARKDFNNLIEEVSKSEINVRSMPSYNGNRAYRDSVASFFKLYKIILEQDYSKVVNMEEIAEQSYDAMEAYFTARDLVSKRLQEQNERLNVELKRFGEANNIEIKDGHLSQIGKMMKIISEVHEHYDPIYLNFFKVHKQYGYLSNALNSKNVAAIEQNKNTLINYATEALSKCNEFTSYNGDNSLITNSKRIIETYLKYANDFVQPQLDYIISEENFKKLESELKKKSNKTKEDVDAFNKEVDNMNKLVKKSNESVNYNNNVISPALNNYNMAISNFFDKHIPVYK